VKLYPKGPHDYDVIEHREPITAPDFFFYGNGLGGVFGEEPLAAAPGLLGILLSTELGIIL
jgi:hypothetical protein